MTHTRRLLAWPFIVAAAAVVLLAAVAAVVVVHAQDGPIPGGVYAGTLVDSDGSCSQGALTLGDEFEMGLDSPGTAVRLITLHDLDYVRDSHGRTRETVHQRVEFAIASDGSFDGDVVVGGALWVQIEGRFQGDTVAGSFRVTVEGVDECVATFNAQGSPRLPLEPGIRNAGIQVEAFFCGLAGRLSVTVSSDGLSLIQAGIADLRDITGERLNPTLATGSATFDEGTVPIAADGTFGWVYFPGSEPGQEIALTGTFAPWFSGIVTISPAPPCILPLRFSGGPQNLGAFLLPSSGPAGADPSALPDTGGGPAVDRGRIGLVWPALAAAAVATLVLALALLRRRRV